MILPGLNESPGDHGQKGDARADGDFMKPGDAGELIRFRHDWQLSHR